MENEKKEQAIRAYVRHNRSLTLTPWEIKEGKYNEFYYPSLGPYDELWIHVTDSVTGETTMLHLKR